MEENKKNNNVLIIVIAVVAVAAIIAMVLLLKNNEKTPNNSVTPGDEQLAEPYTFSEKELVTFTHKICEGKLTQLSNGEGTVKVKYPTINSKDETVVALNNLISERTDNYITNYILDDKELTEEDVTNHTGECEFVIQSSDKKMKSNLYYEYLDFEIIDREDYMYIVEYFRVRTLNGSIGNDIFNIYNIDKKTGKVVENIDIVKNIKNKDEIKNKIVSFVEANRNLDYEYLTDKEIKDFINEIKTKMDKNEFKIYYNTEGHAVIIFNELLKRSTYGFIYDQTQQTITLYN